MSEDKELQCYNRGCGKKYKPSENKYDSCQHHPGDPFFHDAYKGWSCCNKKCTDFTEFLNIRGCSLSKHSNVKPPEPEKPVAKDIPDTEVIEVKPIIIAALPRPSFETPMTTMEPQVAPSLKQQISQGVGQSLTSKSELESDEIAIGTVCKNGGCSVSYEGPQTNSTKCVYHPGVPIFHEGLKFWSCCQKRTTDFNAFLNQIGCEHGVHLWKKNADNNRNIQCRWDHHQTASHVIVSIYAKQYCPNKSVIKLNPIRLYVSLVFPEQNDSIFLLDIELRGVIDVKESQVSMYGTKVEIKLKKAEPGSWSKLEIPRPTSAGDQGKPQNLNTTPVEQLTPQVDAVDLSDL